MSTFTDYNHIEITFGELGYTFGDIHLHFGGTNKVDIVDAIGIIAAFTDDSAPLILYTDGEGVLVSFSDNTGITSTFTDN